VRYLIDTDWVIHYLNGHPEIVPRVQEISAENIGLSLISLAELYEGVRRFFQTILSELKETFHEKSMLAQLGS
jgi:predicted nucleic acid-binding protein